MCAHPRFAFGVCIQIVTSELWWQQSADLSSPTGQRFGPAALDALREVAAAGNRLAPPVVKQIDAILPRTIQIPNFSRTPPSPNAFAVWAPPSRPAPQASTRSWWMEHFLNQLPTLGEPETSPARGVYRAWSVGERDREHPLSQRLVNGLPPQSDSARQGHLTTGRWSVPAGRSSASAQAGSSSNTATGFRIRARSQSDSEARGASDHPPDSHDETAHVLSGKLVSTPRARST